MRYLLIIYFGLQFSGLSAQQVVRDTFMDLVSSKKYVVSGYFAPRPEMFGTLPLTETGYYVTTMQMHNDWAYLTNSFSQESWKRTLSMSVQDTMNLRLTSIISAKDTQIMSLQRQVVVQDSVFKEQVTLYESQNQILLTRFSESEVQRKELEFKLDTASGRKKNWQGLSFGFLFAGFLIGALAFN
jgi:hypothetical protein